MCGRAKQIVEKNCGAKQVVEKNLFLDGPLLRCTSMPKLTGMSTPGYNGLACDLVCTKSPNRVGARLPTGRTVAVRLECIECDVTPPSCPVCHDPLFGPTIKQLSCGHEMHWWCIKQWRATANANPEAAGARCPVCRAYVGLSDNQPALKKHALEIVFQALGAIHQTVARLDGKPEPSMEDELTAVTTQIDSALGQNPEVLNRFETLRQAYWKKDKSGAATLYETLECILVMCCCYPCGTETTVSSNYPRAIEIWLSSLLQQDY